MTLRQIYTRATFSHRIPKQDIDVQYMYMLDWFYELRSYIDRYDVPISPSFIADELSDKYPSPDECATLIEMDRAYRVAMRETISKFQKDLVK